MLQAYRPVHFVLPGAECQTRNKQNERCHFASGCRQNANLNVTAFVLVQVWRFVKGQADLGLSSAETSPQISFDGSMQQLCGWFLKLILHRTMLRSVRSRYGCGRSICLDPRHGEAWRGSNPHVAKRKKQSSNRSEITDFHVQENGLELSQKSIRHFVGKPKKL